MGSPAKNPARIVAFRLLIPIVTLVVLTFLAEGYLHLTKFDPLGPYLKHRRRPYLLRLAKNKYLFYELNPGFDGKIRGVHLKINSAGFRGPEIKSAKGEGVRIIVLGDSITFAANIQEENTFATLLEKHLKQINPKCEVLNFGVDGYDTCQEVICLESHGLKFSPDIVLVVYCLNDIGVIPPDKHTLKKLSIPEMPFYFRLRIGQWLYLKFCKLELLRELKMDMRNSKISENYYNHLFPPAEKDEFLVANFHQIRRIQKSFQESGVKDKHIVASGKRLWLNQYLSLKNIGKIQYSFKRLRQLSKEYGFEVVVLIIPFFYKVNGEYVDFPAHKIVKHIAENIGLETEDFYTDFDAAGLESVTTEGLHMNKRGHELFARFLTTKLKPRLLRFR